MTRVFTEYIIISFYRDVHLSTGAAALCATETETFLESSPGFRSISDVLFVSRIRLFNHRKNFFQKFIFLERLLKRQALKKRSISETECSLIKK